jgi:release factor glutamine methyltransferase
MTINEALTKAAEKITRRDARLLLAAVMRQNQAFLIAHDKDFLTAAEQEKFAACVVRRAAGEPLQYIVGKQEFYNLEFEVNRDVLIPRPETEILVETAIEILEKQKNHNFCDIGTGTGCIAIAILKNLPAASAVAVDVSRKALKVAAGNARKHFVADRLILEKSDVFSAFDSKPSDFSLIVSNPPYVSETDSQFLPREVKDFEPHTALFSGADGLDVIKKLLCNAPQHLIKGGYLLFEIGYGQSETIIKLIDKNIWNLIKIRADLQKIPRVVVLQLKADKSFQK